MVHGEGYRLRDEAVLARRGVGLHGRLRHCGVGDRDNRVQRSAREPPSCSCGLEHRRCRIPIGSHHHAALHGLVQIREHVALRQRGQEQLLRIVPVGIAVERAIC